MLVFSINVLRFKGNSKACLRANPVMRLKRPELLGSQGLTSIAHDSCSGLAINTTELESNIHLSPLAMSFPSIESRYLYFKSSFLLILSFSKCLASPKDSVKPTSMPGDSKYRRTTSSRETL